MLRSIAVVASLIAMPVWAEVGRVVQAENAVIIRGSETIVAEEGTPVDEGDLLQTTPFGLIHVLLNDETKFVVGPGTAISIDTALVGQSEGTFESLAVGMTGGLFRMISGNSESEAYRVNTPSATMGIRGTAFDTCVSREDLLIVHEGIVQTCLRDPATGEPDLATCTDAEAQPDACPVITALETPEGDRFVGQALESSILQCRLSYQQEELGVLESFRVNDLACRAAAQNAAGNTQPEQTQPEEEQNETHLEEEEEGLNNLPDFDGGSDVASASNGSRSAAVSTRLVTRTTGGGAGGTNALCSKDNVIAILEGRCIFYVGLRDSSTSDGERLAYGAAIRILGGIIQKVRQAPLVGESCAKLEAILATACRRTSSHSRLEGSCVIAALNSGL